MFERISHEDPADHPTMEHRGSEEVNGFSVARRPSPPPPLLPPLPPYPTGSTVPFPYGSPYPQQIALMDAMLGSLRARDEREELEKDTRGGCDGNDGGDGGAAASRPARKKRRRRASLVMLESPTGTGKSLSLACAAVAWLRHREQADLLGLRQSSGGAGGPERGVAGAAPASVGAVTEAETGVDWIDSFLSPEERAAEERGELERRGRKRAAEARAALEGELRGIRDRVDRTAGTIQSSKAGVGRDRVRTVREGLARGASEAARAAERRRRRRGRGAGGVGTVVKRSRPGAGSAAERADADFCLQEYDTDDGGGILGPGGGGRRHDDDSSSGDDQELHKVDSFENDWSKDDRVLPWGRRYGPRKGGGERKQPLPSELLAGGKLDGSGFDPIAHRPGPLGGGGGGPDPPPSLGSQIIPALGSVRPGSGVRKIIYAARTHSQLSQFVGELRRTVWGSDLRVVALGGRKLLCGNKDVVGAGKRRSEKDVTERCLDLKKDKASPAALGGAVKAGEKRKGVQDTSPKGAAGCPLLSSREAVSTLAVHLLVRPSDIEDTSSLGKASNACAYYASRVSRIPPSMLAL
jgi:hypothetical protein